MHVTNSPSPTHLVMTPTDIFLINLPDFCNPDICVVRNKYKKIVITQCLYGI